MRVWGVGAAGLGFGCLVRTVSIGGGEMILVGLVYRSTYNYVFFSVIDAV